MSARTATTPKVADKTPTAKAATSAKPASAKPAAASAKPAAAKPMPKAATAPKTSAAAKAATEAAVEEIEATILAEEAAANGGKHRQQMTEILGVSIPAARCGAHLRAILSKPELDAQIKALRADLKEAKGDAVQEKAFKDKINELTHNIVRIASDTPVAVAVLADIIVKELIRLGMGQAIACDHKIVRPADYRGDGVAQLRAYPFINKLPTFAGFSPEREDELCKEQAAANKALKEAREAKKAGEGEAAAKAAPKAADDDADDEDGHSRSTFNTYVNSALQVVKEDPELKTMRVSGRVRQDLAEIIAEFLVRIANVARVLVDNIANARTMQAKHIKAAAEILMIEEQREQSEIDKILAVVDEKLAIYHTHMQATKDQKAASLGDEKKAEIERKKHEAELLRAKRQMEASKKRALENAQRAKDLVGVVSALEPVVAREKAAADAAAAAAAAAASAAAAANDAAVDALLAE